MKKYLNKNLFYQGDANIFLPLCIVYIVNFILILLISENYFSWEIKGYIFSDREMRFIFSYEAVLLLIVYIGIIYMLSVGIFKRKKWATFLSGPFSRLDIRKRELAIVIISIVVYIITFLSVILKYYIQYYDVLVYFSDFNKFVLLDVIRIIGISILGIGILSILDSVFSNLYYLFASTIISFIYLLFLLVNFESILSYNTMDNVYGLRYVYNGLIEYIGGVSIGNRISTFQIIFISIIFILIGIIMIFISKLLTNRMLVENMNEGIILNFPKKIASFIIMTFVGVITAPFLSNLINSIYFDYGLGLYKEIVLRLVVIIIMSIASNFVYRNFKKNKKEVYY